METPRLEVPRSGERMLEHEGFRISYNQSWLIPNWVAYELTKEETRGDVERTDYFDVDPTLKGRQAKFADYSHTGYDRGHMAPAGDMKWSETAMKESFYLSNICPQNHNLNSGDWKSLEEHLRTMATQYDKVYIVCGPIVSTSPKTIGKEHKVTVPAAFFKAVLRQKGDSWSAIGFMFANEAGHKNLSTYAMSIEDLQIVTDLDFFYNLPDKIEEEVEATYSLSDWDL